MTHNYSELFFLKNNIAHMKPKVKNNICYFTTLVFVELPVTEYS